MLPVLGGHQVAAVEYAALRGPSIVDFTANSDFTMDAPLQPWFFKFSDAQELAAHSAAVT